MIHHIDHIVLTTAHEDAYIDFYTRIMGMELNSFIGGTPPVERKAFRFGNKKNNLHVKGKEFEPNADIPTSGSFDLFFKAWGLPQIVKSFSTQLELAHSF